MSSSEASFMEGVEVSEDGYLFYDQGNQGENVENSPQPQSTKGAGKPLPSFPTVLEGAKCLWFVFHPQYSKESSIAEESNIVMEEETRAVTMEPSEKTPLESLKQYQNLASKTLAVLEDVDRMRDVNRDLTKKEKEEREKAIEKSRNHAERNIRSLERQAQALQRGASSGNESADIDDDEKNDNDENKGEEVGNQDDRTAKGATFRVVKALNSMRLLYPILVRMLNHPSRGDKEIDVGTHKLKEERQWLLGEHIYDFCSKKNVKSLLRMMENLLIAFQGGDDPDRTKKAFRTSVLAGQIPWKDLIPTLLQKYKVSFPEFPTTSPWTILQKHCGSLSGEKMTEIGQNHDKVFLTQLHANRGDAAQKSKFAKAVRNLMNELHMVLQNRFAGSELHLYGSYLSDLSLGKSSDIDLSVRIPKLNLAKMQFEQGVITASAYDKERKRTIYALQSRLGNNRKDSFADVFAVVHARVPVIKGRFLRAKNPYSPDGSMHFDLCFFNDIAVTNSCLLTEYTFVSSKSKNLLLAVKKWAKENRVSSAMDDSLSSYAWINLAIFYMQSIGMMPNLQSRELMQQLNFEVNPAENPSHFVGALDTAFLSWETVQRSGVWQPSEEVKDLPLSVLLYGFFWFYSEYFPQPFYAASIKLGGAIALPKACFPRVTLTGLCIEDPFETHDSHCPHDLGSPATEKGKEIIRKLMIDARKHLEQVFLGEEIAAGELWPKLEPEPANDGEKQIRETQKGSNRQRQKSRGNKKQQSPEQKGESKTQDGKGVKQQDQQQGKNKQKGNNKQGSPKQQPAGAKQQKSKRNTQNDQPGRETPKDNQGPRQGGPPRNQGGRGSKNKGRNNNNRQQQQEDSSTSKKGGRKKTGPSKKEPKDQQSTKNANQKPTAQQGAPSGSKVDQDCNNQGRR